MSSVTLNSYKVFCTTENTDVYTYGYQETPPTVCPHNTTHSINASTIEVVNSYTIPGTFILTDTSLTSGHSTAYGLNAEFPLTTPGTVQESPISALPFNVKVSTIIINPANENFYDVVTVYIPYNQTVGTLTTSASSGDSVVAVDSAAYAAIYVGFTLRLTDGLTTEEILTVLDKNPSTQELTLSSPIVNSYSNGSTVQMSIPRIVNMLLNSSSRIQLNSRVSNPFLLSAGNSGVIRYTNNDGRYKQLNMVMEYYY